MKGKSMLFEADEFEREVAQLGSNEAFMHFLEGRSKEAGVISIEDFAKDLPSADERLSRPLEP